MHLVLEVFSDKSGAFLFLPCSHKMPLLICCSQFVNDKKGKVPRKPKFYKSVLSSGRCTENNIDLGRREGIRIWWSLVHYAPKTLSVSKTWSGKGSTGEN